MKKHFLIASTALTISTSVLSYDGIVLVLEAPLLREPSLSSTVLQVLRKGSKVYVPNEIGNAESMPEFIPTFDRAGNPAFIPSRYVKVITGQVNEKNQPISYKGNDPTDYRLEEPIPVTYPFPNKNFARASVSFIVGNNANSVYSYNSPFIKQSYGAEFGGRVSVMRKIAFDKNDRFYFGLITLVGTTSNNLSFTNANTAEESRMILRAGPWITYDAYKTENYNLTIGTGFTFNYHQSKLSVSNELLGEDRSFSGFSIAPMTSTQFMINDIIPNTDFITGIDFSLYLPHTLKSSNEPQNPELWGEDNQISGTLKTQLALFLGLQVKY